MFLINEHMLDIWYCIKVLILDDLQILPHRILLSQSILKMINFIISLQIGKNIGMPIKWEFWQAISFKLHH